MSKGLQIPFQFATSEAPARPSGISGSSGGLGGARRAARNSASEASREPHRVFLAVCAAAT